LTSGKLDHRTTRKGEEKKGKRGKLEEEKGRRGG